MLNFVPNETKTFNPRDPEWLNGNVKSMLRKQDKLYRKYKKNGYKVEDKTVLDKLKIECAAAITSARESFLRKQGAKLADPSTGQKNTGRFLMDF